MPTWKKPKKSKRRRFVPSNNTKINVQKKLLDKNVPLHMRELTIDINSCPECPNGGQVIDDRRGGKRVCTRCGLVVNKSYVSEESEWRNFADSDKSGPDMNRVGNAGHYLLQDDADLSTSISSRENTFLSNLQESTAGNYHVKKISDALRTIKKRCETSGLNLAENIQNASAELYAKIIGLKEFNRKNNMHIIATCIYVCAKIGKAPRTLKELCMNFKIQKTDIRKVHTIMKKLEASNQLTMPRIISTTQESTAMVFGAKFVMDYKLPSIISRNVRKVIDRMEKNGILTGKQPTTKAGIAIYIVTNIVDWNQLKKDKIEKTKSQISSQFKDNKHLQYYKKLDFKLLSQKSNVSELTMSAHYKKHVFPHLKKLIPEGFGDKILKNSLMSAH